LHIRGARRRPGHYLARGNLDERDKVFKRVSLCYGRGPSKLRAKARAFGARAERHAQKRRRQIERSECAYFVIGSLAKLSFDCTRDSNTRVTRSGA